MGHPQSGISAHTSFQSGAGAAHDQPFAVALLEKIHPNKLAASIFPALAPFFFDSGTGHSNIAVYLHVYRSVFEPLEFVMEGLEVGEKGLLGNDLAGGDGCEVVGVDLTEPGDVAGH